jgi:YbgC/YbaW family acyl-CoA thioester hydrolase
MKPFVFETRIRFIDTDASGRIHYTCMFRYFESAETEFFRSLGVSYIMPDLAFPRVHVECDYKASLVYDDLIQIEVRLGRVGGTSVKLNFQTFKGGQLAAEGNVVLVCMQKSTQRPVAIPAELRDRLVTDLLPS